ncbi:methyltransferase domain-containing protein [Parasphingorhabdus sp.]|uniref:methyltransferase domain-containing protein n=1 Tax=Parasphingorhabdus sp. TaxID=2709688 RepID=UPI003265074B
MSEFHDLAELALNREGQSWGNLGYWESATHYSDACRALAKLLGEQAGLDHHSRVLDAGFGCGDQLLLWCDQFDVAQIDGVNLSRSQTAHAKDLLRQNRQTKAADTIVQGDINDPDVWSAALNGARPSHVLALDCAYHFPDRPDFFALAQQHLAPAGRLALTDFMLADQHRTDSPMHRLLRWMLKRSHIAEANIVHRDQYLRQLRDAGFDAIHIVDISEQVMPAFAQGLRASRRKNRNGAGRSKLGWSSRIKYNVTGRFLTWAYRRSILRYCLISATRII